MLDDAAALEEEALPGELAALRDFFATAFAAGVAFALLFDPASTRMTGNEMKQIQRGAVFGSGVVDWMTRLLKPKDATGYVRLGTG